MGRRSRIPDFVSRTLIEQGVIGGGPALPTGQAYGFLYLDTGYDTPDTETNDYPIYVDEETTTLAQSSDSISSPVSGRLRYDGAAPTVFLVHQVTTLRCRTSDSSNYSEYGIAVGQQGKPGPKSINAGDSGRLATHAMLISTMKPNEVIDGFAYFYYSAVQNVSFHSLIAKELLGAYGLIKHTVDGASTSAGWQLIPCTTGLHIGNEFSMPSNMRLRYDGAVTKKFRVDLTYTHDESSSDYADQHGIYENGVLVAESVVARRGNNNGRASHVHTHCFVELAQNDYVEGYINRGGASSTTVRAATLGVAELGAAYGLLYLTATGTYADNATWTKAPGTTSIGATVADFSQEANNRLRYDGAVTKKFVVSADVSLSFTGATSSINQVCIYKNGTIVPGTTQLSFKYGADKPITLTTQAIIELAEDDYVEVWLQKADSLTTTVHNIILSAAEFA